METRDREIYVVPGLFMLMGIIQKPTLRSYFTAKRAISTPGVRDIITRDRLELICSFFILLTMKQSTVFKDQ
jgi:hypothetical protein